jgi:hypothetical protein
MDSPAIIGFWGGMALLISSITGPGLTTSASPRPNAPKRVADEGQSLFCSNRLDGLRSCSQSSARTMLKTRSPTIAFLVFGVISGSVSLFLVETMSTIHGNESFQSRVEYATVAHLYLGDKIHVFMQILLYCALQSVNISSIIISEQVRIFFANSRMQR